MITMILKQSHNITLIIRRLVMRKFLKSNIKFIQYMKFMITVKKVQKKFRKFNNNKKKNMTK